MPFLIAGLVLFWLGSVGLKMFVRASPALLARRLQQAGTVVCFGLAALLLLRGRIDVALGLAGLGYWFSRGAPKISFRNLGRAASGRSRRMSRVRSAMIEMALDHGSGMMTGMVLAGPDEGVLLDQMSRAQCLSLYQRCLSYDPEGARLLEAYFDRRFSRWRQAGDDGGDSRGSNSSGHARGRPGAMSEDEAHEVLGLAKSATREDIARAHRTLMKKFHPDHGGSTDLAARVNEAKDVLMRRHP